MIQENFNQKREAEADLPSTQMQRQITASRERMSHTINEISDELQPKRLIETYVDDYSEAVVDTLSRKAKHIAAETAKTIKEHPIPTLAIVAGILFLVSASSEKSDPEPRSEKASR